MMGMPLWPNRPCQRAPAFTEAACVRVSRTAPGDSVWPGDTGLEVVSLVAEMVCRDQIGSQVSKEKKAQCDVRSQEQVQAS